MPGQAIDAKLQPGARAQAVGGGAILGGPSNFEGTDAFRAAFEAHPDGMYWLEPEFHGDALQDFTLVELNSAGALLIRLKPSQARGQRLSRILRGGDSPEWLDCIRRVWEGIDSETFRLPLHDPTGLLATRWVDLQVRRVGKGVLAIVRESTAQQQVERRLAFLQDHQQHTESIAKVGSWTYDLKRRRAWWSPEAYRVMGLREGLDMPSYRNFLTAVHPDDRERVEHTLEEAKADLSEFAYEFRLNRADGAERLIISKGRVLADETGKAARFSGIVQDVTEVRATEARTRTIEDRVRRVIANAPIILFELDAEGTVVFSQGRALERQGLKPEEVVGHSIFYLYADYPQLLANIRRALAGETLVVTNQSRGGVFQRWLEPVRDEQGQVTGLFGVTLDVTQLHGAEADLRASQALLQTVLNRLPHFVWAKDPEGRYTIVNQAMASFHNSKPEEMIGKHVQELATFAPSTAQEHENSDEHVRRDRQAVDATMTLNRVDEQEEYWFRVQKMPLVVEGHYTGLVGIAEDITERRRITEELEQSRQLLRVIFDTFPARIMVTDDAARPVLINRAQAVAIGLAPEEALRQGVGCPPLPAAEKAKVEGEIDAVLAQGASYDYERPRRNSDGATVFDRILRVPVQGTDGSIRGALNVGIDITRQKAAEAQLLQAQKMEAVGQLAGGVAHDFNNLLQIIHGYGQLALRGAAEGSNMRTALDRVLGAAERAANLTRQLLTFSRGRLLKSRPCDLNDLLSDLMKMLGRLIGEHIDLQLELVPVATPIHADPGLIEQLVMNLCVNARDAMPEGGTLKLSTEVVTLNADFCRSNELAAAPQHVLLMVSDSGSGIPAGDIGRLFEPFFTTKAEGQGTGLGLSIVYGIVRQHGGLIQVNSAVDQGTTFSIYLPACDQMTRAKEDTQRAPVPGGTETILVAEDEEHVLGLQVDLLQSQGYKVLSARDGQEAIQLYERHRDDIDLVLLDVVMPKAGGRDVVRSIRQQNPAVPILLSTGYMSDTVDADFIGQHDLSVLEKPYSPYELFRRVRTLLDAPCGAGSKPRN